MGEDKVKAFIEKEISEKLAFIDVETAEVARLQLQIETELAQKQGRIAEETAEVERLKVVLAVHLGQISLPGNGASAKGDAVLQEPNPIDLNVEPRGYRNIAIVLAKHVFLGGSFTTRKMVNEIHARKWKDDDNDQLKAKNITAILSVEADFVRVSKKHRDHLYQLADKHMKSRRF